MAIARVGTFTSAYGSSVTKNVTAGSIVVFMASCASSAATPFNAPTKSGTCTIGTITQVINASDGLNEGVGIWWMEVTGSGSLTLTINIASGSDPGGSIHEYSGADLTTPVGASNETEATSTTPNVPLTGVLAGSVVMMIGSEEDTTPRTATPTSPYSEQTEEGDHFHSTVDYIVPSNGSYTPQFTMSGANHRWQAGAVEIKAAAGGSPQTVNLSAAALTAGGQALSVTPGAISTSLSAAALAASGPQLSVTPGAVSLAMSVASLLVSGQATTITPGAVSTALLAAALQALGQTIGVSAGGSPQTVNLLAAALTASGQTAAIQPGAASTALAAALLQASGQALSVQPGAISVALAEAQLAASGQTITITPGAVSIALANALLAAAGQGVTLSPGAVSIALAAALANALGAAITITAPSGLVVDLNTATLTAGGQIIGITPGAVSLALAAAGLSASGQALDVQPGLVSLLLDAASLSASGQALTVTPGAVSILLDAASLLASGQVMDVVLLVVVVGHGHITGRAREIQIDGAPRRIVITGRKRVIDG